MDNQAQSTVVSYEALYAVVKVCFKDQPAGHWVTFKATVSGVKLLAISYAWTQRGVSYIF
jgi:hypothetical protein